MSAIRNPVEWIADLFSSTSRHVGDAGRAARGTRAGESAPDQGLPVVRKVTIGDLRDALRLGMADFSASRTDVAFLVIIYPLAGLAIAWMSFDYALLPLLFPAAAGFTLLGPVAAVGLYEMSRRREQGENPGWADAFGVIASPSFGAIFLLGLVLLGIFLVWLGAAQAVYSLTLGPEPPASLESFVTDIFSTNAGWTMLIVGMGIGFLFAVAVLAISVVSFPLLLDRETGLPVAVATSVRVVVENPVSMAVWGLIVAGGLVIGTLPAFLGLIVILPILGHATWHLYRKAVVPPGEG